MKKVSLLLILLLLSSFSLLAEESILTHHETNKEAAQTLSRDFYETDPPVGPVRQTAEFEPMEGVLVRYPFGISTNLIAEMAEDVIVYTLVANQSEENNVTNQYSNAGVNLNHCEFIHAPSDSYWTRDYGPWFMVDGNNDVGIVNFRYNRPRPNDNDVPIEVAEDLDVELYGMNVVHTGGNYMTDGMGISASTTIVYSESADYGISQAQVDERMLDYLGIHTYHVVQDPNNTYIDHIDCWGKFLDVDKILIREVPQSHAQYDEIEDVVDYFAAQTSSYGTPYEIYRVYTPQDQPYTNSLILNDKVFVPITGSSYDDEALETYENAMPGYEVHGFTGSWESTDALHCRTRGIADRGMLYVRHIPLLGNQPTNTVYELEFTITPYSGESILLDQTHVYYQVNSGDFQSANLTHQEGNVYTASIPMQEEGDEIAYYLHAEDASGRTVNHPFIGEADPHVFFVGAPIPPELEINPTEINVQMDTAGTHSEFISLENSGGGIIHYELHLQNETRNLTGSTVECNTESFLPGENLNLSFEVTCSSNDNEWIEEVWLDFPDGVTVESATDISGGNGGDIPYDGTTGNGAEVYWGGNGYMANGNVAQFEVNVTIDAGFADDMHIDWTIHGDEWGSDPHTIEGEIIIESEGEPITWLSLSETEGELNSGESVQIEVIFNTNTIEVGNYSCFIVIEDDRNETLIPVSLLYEDTNSPEDIIQPKLEMNAYPNPFNPTTNIRFSVQQQQFVELNIYNVKGKRVKNLFRGLVDDSEKIVSWNGMDNKRKPVSSGIYFYQLETEKNGILSKKMMLLK